MQPETGVEQMLPQVAILASVNLAVCVVEIVVFDKAAELRVPIVIGAGKHLPGEVRVVFPSAVIKHMCGCVDFNINRLRIITADPSPGIRLESSEREPEDEVSHKRASV